MATNDEIIPIEDALKEIRDGVYLKSDSWSTRLNGYFLDWDKKDRTKLAIGNCDWDCLRDLEDADKRVKLNGR